MPTIYTFEAKSIQNYILDSSKLKDMIGASEQIEYLCHKDGLLDQVLNSLGLKYTQFARRAGGAFQAIFSNYDDAIRFQAVWTFSVQQAMPGLNFVQGIGTNDDWKQAIKDSEQAFKQDDHTRLSFTLPLAGPLVARSPRTGQPAVSYNQIEEGIERIDSITETKRQFSKGTLLIDKLNDFDVEIDWPTNLDNKDYIAIIHADVNNLGQLFQKLRKELLENSEITEYPNILTQISQIIKDSIEQSAKQVTKDILSKQANIQTNKKADKKFIMPARPLVLGGDDFTFIVRGDLALDFTQVFLEEFEKNSKDKLSKLEENYPELATILPEYLTACAGIVYIKASQPFFRAYTLVESLCKQAKIFSRGHSDKNKLIPSSIIFHRITTSIIDDYNTILDEELTTTTGIKITMQPYLVGQVKPSQNQYECIRLDDLYELSNFLKEDAVSHGTVREFLTMLEINRQQAEQGLKRWYDNMVLRKQVNLEHLQQILETLVKRPDDKFYKDNPTDLKLIGDFQKNKCTPIGDALALLHINKGSDYV